MKRSLKEKKKKNTAGLGGGAIIVEPVLLLWLGITFCQVFTTINRVENQQQCSRLITFFKSRLFQIIIESTTYMF